MSTYHPTPERIERDADTLQSILAMALRRLDERDPAAARRAAAKHHEETFIGHCYSTGEPRRQAT